MTSEEERHDLILQFQFRQLSFRFGIFVLGNHQTEDILAFAGRSFLVTDQFRGVFGDGAPGCFDVQGTFEG
jgi:hypothetical protein